MKKTILASVIAGLGVGLAGAASAQSNVQVYGLIDTFLASEKNGPNSALKIDSGGMTTSFWGIKGTEDLGGGLKAVFALEAFIRNDTGDPGRFPGDPAFARSSYLGLQGGFGQVQLGRNTTPYFVSTLLANPFVDSFGFSPEILRTFGTRNYVIGDTGWANSVLYSGNFGGVGLNAIYTFGDESFTTSSSGRGLGLSANYFAGPLMITGAFQTKNSSGVAPAKQNSFRLGGAYDFGVARVFASYQTIKDRDGLVTAGLTNADHNGFQVGVSAPVGPGSVLFSYGTTKSDGVGGKGTRNVFALGYDYNLSKRTDVYAAFYNDSGDVALPSAAWQTKIQRIGVGLRHKF